MAIKIIPEEKFPQKTERWLNFVFVLSFILFFLALFFSFLLFFLLKKTKASLEELQKRGLLQTEEEKKLEKTVLLYQKKFQDLNQLLETHQKVTNLFFLLERNSHPQVRFVNFKLDVPQKLLTLEGKTENFEFLAQQQKIFEENPAFLRTKLQKVSLGERGKVRFFLSLLINPEIFLR